MDLNLTKQEYRELSTLEYILTHWYSNEEGEKRYMELSSRLWDQKERMGLEEYSKWHVAMIRDIYQIGVK